ncbi:MAG: hypothetical protein M1814_005860 [Vezdaea aestivalis]|nr:MAG: hypothetical protein M1814_005860 [Vezdaea aestivalis]
MADTTVNKLDYEIKDLETTSVTLSPHAATVVRRINDIVLKPGPNEITIYGLTPTIEEHSLQFDGQGAASIADMTVEYVDNKDRFESHYDSGSNESSDDEESEAESQPDTKEKSVRKKKASLEAELGDQREKLQVTKNQVDLLERYGKTLDSKNSEPAKVVEFLKMYDKSREDLYRDHKVATVKVNELECFIKDESKKLHKLKDIRRRRHRKANKQKRKDAQKKAQIKADKAIEKARAKEEKEGFWPLKVYKLVLLLEAPLDASSISHRNSVEVTSKDAAISKVPAAGNPISLSFSYVSNEAMWWPAYDLKLQTPSKSGTLAYRAEFKNTTSETWRNAKLALTTSQTAFSGLTKTVPILTPWHVRLQRNGSGSKYNSTSQSWHGGLQSQREIDAKKSTQAAMFNKPNRQEMFMMKGSAKPTAYGSTAEESYRNTNTYPVQQQQVQAHSHFPPPRPQAVFGSAAPDTSSRSRTLRLGSHSNAVPGHGGPTAPMYEAEGGGGAGDDEDDTDSASISTMTNALGNQESSREDFGLTTTYTIPTLRTLVPSDLTRRHNLADLALPNITLSHIVIPKLQTAAFLKARIKNTSSTILLKGRANLTLDGTFLGNTTIPRASPDESFTLTLGVDPTVSVTYAKPTVRRSSSGVFTKNENVIYTRVVGLTNKKATRVELLVLDQVPVSEDEGLKVSVLEPAGLRHAGDRVKCGKGTTGGNWGSAVATMAKGGEISWTVTLEKSAGCKLVLEYLGNYPASDAIVGMD